MSDTNGKKTLGLPEGSRTGQVKQSFARGRTKSVVVETKRKRVVVAKKPDAGAPTDDQNAKAKPIKGVDGATDAEMERRLAALRKARAREAEEAERRKREEEERAAERARRRAEMEAKEREGRAAEAARIELEQQRKREEEERAAAAPSSAETTPPPAAKPDLRTPAPAGGHVDAGRRREESRPERRPRGRGDSGRRAGKLTVNQALASGEGGRQRSLASIRRKQEKARQKATGSSEREKIVRDVQLPETIVVSELANRMAERGAAVVKALMTNGIMVTQNHSIDADTAELIVQEFGHRAIRVSDADVEDVIDTVKDKPEDLERRPPIVTIMGHVDHGKTSLLDAIRKTKIAAEEAGGITQHIGAYQVKTANATMLTFLDTPGHAAFTAMRARGAQVTDIVVLVVAADDSVMPQTIEAINHSRAANVPIIVAINKSDKAGADADRVRTGLLQHSVIVEKMSGEVQDAEVSAQTGQGLDELLEAIALQAELLELKANPARSAAGAVIEAKLDVGRGPVATVLVQNGTLKKGDVFVVGQQWGKVRALINDQGVRVSHAAPSVPVEVLGLNGTPEAGDILNVVDTESQAREIAAYRAQVARDRRAAAGTSTTTLDQLMAKARADENVAELPVIVKSDVQGSSEAIVQALEKLGTEDVRVRILHAGVGAITESDVGLAEASNAPVIGFNVRANAPARTTANQKGVELRYYSVIYDLVNDVEAAASGLRQAEIREKFVGYAEIKEIFRVSGVGNVAGCLVTEGMARRAARVRLLRDSVVIHEGTLKTLKRFQNEVSEVPSGQECGMAFENYDDIRKADVIEIFETEEVARTPARSV